MKFTFVIPTINQTVILDTCLNTLRSYHGNDVEVIVVDDGSPKKTQEEVRLLCEKYRAKLLCNSKNSGFACSVNRGIDAATGDVVVLTNNDIVFTKNVVEPLTEAFNVDGKIGIVGGLLFYPNRTIQHGGIFHYKDEVFLHRGWHKQLTEAPEVQRKEYIIAVTGALFAIRKTMADQLGVLSTRYFLAFEDTEYCLRAWEKGWKVYYSHEVSAIHAEGATRGNTPAAKMVKGREWFVKENKSKEVFKEDLIKFNLVELQAKVHIENTRKHKKVVFNKNLDCGVIGIHRAGALGDVLLSTGIVRRLKSLHPNYDIHFSTQSPQVLLKNPYINRVVRDKGELNCNILFDLDMVYESNPRSHIIDSYANHVFEENVDRDLLIPEMFSNESDRQTLMKKIPPTFLEGDVAVVHMAVSWPNRTWQRQKWIRVIDYLLSKKMKVVVVGRGGDFKPDYKDNVVDMINKLNVLEVRELMQMSKIFLGMDSGLLHIAQTTNIGIIGLFTCANPAYRLIRRKSAKTIPLTPKVSCRFCLHEETPPITFVGCRAGTYQCLVDITVQDAISAIKQLGY